MFSAYIQVLIRAFVKGTLYGNGFANQGTLIRIGWMFFSANREK